MKNKKKFKKRESELDMMLNEIIRLGGLQPFNGISTTENHSSDEVSDIKAAQTFLASKSQESYYNNCFSWERDCDFLRLKMQFHEMQLEIDDLRKNQKKKNDYIIKEQEKLVKKINVILQIINYIGTFAGIVGTTSTKELLKRWKKVVRKNVNRKQLKSNTTIDAEFKEIR